MSDPTEATRREMIETGQPVTDLHTDEGERFTTAELQEKFEVLGFLAPFVTVRRKSDGVTGSFEFTHSSRVYFGFKEHK